MNLYTSRAKAADAIESTIPDGVLVRPPIQADGIRVDTIVALARFLSTAGSSKLRDEGPAIVVVTTPARRKHGAIEVRAYTLTRDRRSLVTGDGLKMRDGIKAGRGLAVVDWVEEAIRGLPGSGLPILETETVPSPLPEDIGKTSVRVWTTTALWPLAFPDSTAAGAGSSTSAIRDHVAAVIETTLPATLTRQRGRTEADRRIAYYAGDVPRAWITLHTQRETIGGSPNFVARESMAWNDADGLRWTAQAVTQTVIVRVSVAHRTEPLADEAAIRIFAGLEGTTVNWPGAFDGRVLEAGVMVTQRLTGGDYQQDIRPLQLDRAEWDAEAGVAVARLQVSVEAMDPIEPATQSVQPTAVEKDVAFVRFQPFVAGTVRRAKAASLVDGQWSVNRVPTVGGAAQELRLRVSPSRREPVSTRWREGTELVLGNPSAPSAVLEITGDASWASATGTADVILLSGELPSVGTGMALQVRDG